MSLHVEYADPRELSFVNELDFVEANGLSFEGRDSDVLLVWYDEVVAIPVDNAAGALAFAQRIIDVVGRASKDGRAIRVDFSDESDCETCNGTGEVNAHDDLEQWNGVPCGDCGGSGKVSEDPGDTYTGPTFREEDD